MSTYVVGDIQGCYSQLQALLEHIQFNENTDTVWFCGDLVNRGPESLQTLLFIKSLGRAAMTVLGNHDLHLLASAYDFRRLKKSDTLDEILASPQKEELLYWLRHLPLVHWDESLQCMMLHAGVDPSWTFSDTLVYAAEAEQVLQSENFLYFLKQMYGNEPHHWDNDLQDVERYRYIVNVLTRLRFCDQEGNLLLKIKTSPAEAPSECTPWFEHLHHSFAAIDLCFGHWAALQGQCRRSKVYALDTGCVWGGALTALRLDDKQRFSVPGYKS